jgi:hypothetical protein
VSTAVLSRGVKLSVRDADHSLPSSAEVKNELIYASTPIRLQGVSRHNFTSLPFTIIKFVADIRHFFEELRGHQFLD